MIASLLRQSSLLVFFLQLTGCAAPDSEQAGTGGSAESTAEASGEVGPDDPAAPVRVGARVLVDAVPEVVRGRRVGLITNHTGIVGTSSGAVVSTVDLLHDHPDIDLVALFGPEHGIRGTAEAGEHVDSSVDEATGLPIHSLYGGTMKPTPEMLKDVEVLLFDIQDIGARYYTYVWSMTLAMEAAAEAGIPFVVLDRPNPLGSARGGNVLREEFASLVGRYPVPMRHGMTPGEVARFVAGEFHVPVELTVVPVEGWDPDRPFGVTGLPWVAPSPNMPDLVSATHYPGTCLFEGTPLSVGRGTDRPFQQVGAPWLDGEELARRLNARGLPDVRFEAVRFTPREPGDGKFGGEEVSGVRLHALGPDYEPEVAAFAALVEARELAGARWSWREAHFDRLAGTDALRRSVEAGADLDVLRSRWADQRAAFRRAVAPYLLYARDASPGGEPGAGADGQAP
jgi:uncharacterized protein YbbC (DUF1343 family)